MATRSLGESDLRVLGTWSSSGLPDVPAPWGWWGSDDEDDGNGNEGEGKNDAQGRDSHSAVAVPGLGLVVIGGKTSSEEVPLRSLFSLDPSSLASGASPCWSRILPDMSYRRNTSEDHTSFGVACVGRKIYVLGGENEEIRWGVWPCPEMLDLDRPELGWTALPEPASRPGNLDARYAQCDVASIDRKIYVVGNDCQDADWQSTMSFDAFDTETNEWEALSLNFGKRKGFSICGLKSRGGKHRGSYIILLGGDTDIVEAYHVEGRRWFDVTTLPDFDDEGSSHREYFTASVLDDRFLLVAGGLPHGGDSSQESYNHAAAFDWEERVWIELDSMRRSRWGCAGAAVDQRWIVTGGWTDYMSGYAPTECLSISSGIGWQKERLLLMCHRGKANDEEGACSLQGLEAGIFARILLYLFKPFPEEVQYEGSIFRALCRSSSQEKLPVAKKARLNPPA